jgi:hypothetical protein
MTGGRFQETFFPEAAAGKSGWPMRFTKRFTRRQWMLAAIMMAVVALHVVCLGSLIRYYGSSFVAEFGEGFAVLYWGGDKAERDNYVLNASEWPPRPETHFAGMEVPTGLKWETYGPDFEFDPDQLADRVQYRRGILGALGYGMPELRRDGDEGSVQIPVGSVALLVEISALLLIVRSRRHDFTSKPASGVSRVVGSA